MYKFVCGFCTKKISICIKVILHFIFLNNLLGICMLRHKVTGRVKLIPPTVISTYLINEMPHHYTCVRSKSECIHSWVRFDHEWSKIISLSPVQLPASLPLPHCKGQLSSSGRRGWRGREERLFWARCDLTHTSPKLRGHCIVLWMCLSARIRPVKTAELIAADCSEGAACITGKQRQRTQAGAHRTEAEEWFSKL